MSQTERRGRKGEESRSHVAMCDRTPVQMRRLWFNNIRNPLDVDIDVTRPIRCALEADVPNLTLGDTAYLELRSRIIRLEIAPGAAFTEGKVAAELGLSKTPVREALTRLRFEGLVVVDPSIGYRAAPVTIKDTREVFAIRTILEGEAARLAAAQATDEEKLRALDDLCTHSYNPSDEASVDRFLEANTRFHIMVARAGGNDRLAAMMEVILNEMERLFRIGLLMSSRSDEIVHEHKTLVNAIMAGDEVRARNAAADQVRAAQRMVLDALIASPEVTTTPIGLPSDRGRQVAQR